jgi:DivIVA domain-containing protein
MGVDQTSLDRIRNATFPSARRGYDKHEVEKFLARLADWLETGGGDESRSDTVKRELERVGQRTGAILAQAEESAQQIRAEAEEEARGTINTANAQARRIVEEGTRRRKDIEAVISDLVRRRDDVLADTEQLANRLGDAIKEHRPSGGDPFATPEELDPHERDGAQTEAVEAEAEDTGRVEAGRSSD